MKTEELDKFIDIIIDSMPSEMLYLNCAKICYRKIKNDEDFHYNDFKVMKIILEDYIKRLENKNVGKKHK